MKTTKMKGLLKGGFRCITQIFKPSSKEQEMQIGFPTDVKHVSHIGWDGPSMNTPTWMKEFRSTPEFPSSTTVACGGRDLPSPARRPLRGTLSASPGRDSPDFPRLRRRHVTVVGDSPLPRGSRQTSKCNHLNGDGPDAPRLPRRNQKLGLSNGVMDLPTADPGGSSPRRRKLKGRSGKRGRRSTSTN